MWTTPTDLARFAIAVQRGLAGDDGPVLSAEMMREMVTAPVEDGYGLGLSLGEMRFGHGGGNRGFKCSLTAFLEGGNGAVVMTNSDSGWDLGAEVMAHLFDHYGWPGLEPNEKTAIEMTQEQLGAFAGTYRWTGGATSSCASRTKVTDCSSNTQRAGAIPQARVELGAFRSRRLRPGRIPVRRGNRRGHRL